MPMTNNIETEKTTYDVGDHKDFSSMARAIKELPPGPVRREAIRQFYVINAREETLTGFYFYCLYVHGWELTPHLLEWAAMLIAGERVVIVAPPDSGKTRLLRAWCEWAIGLRRDRAIMVIGNTIKQAKKVVWAVGQVLSHSPRYKEIFPDIKPTDQWAMDAITVVRTGLPMEFRIEPTMCGFGIDGAYQGVHVDDCIIDDPTDQKDVNSPPTMLMQREQVTGVLYDRLKTGGNLFGILTRWADDDLAPTLEQIGMVIKTFPAYRDKADPYTWDTGPFTEEHPVSLLCESWLNWVQLEQKRHDKLDPLFNLTYLNQTEGAVRGEKVFPRLNKEFHYVSMEKKGRLYTKVKSTRLGADWGPIPEDTEILTRNWWKHRDQLIIGEEVAAYDWNGSRTIVWSPLRAVNRFRRPLVRMSGKSFEFRCSPDHTWIVERPQRGRMTQQTVRRQALHDIQKVHAARLIVAASTNETVSLCTPSEAAVLGWLVTDGCISPKSAVIYQKNEIEAVIAALDASGLQWNEQTPISNGVRLFHLSQDSRHTLFTKVGYTCKEDLPGIVTRLSTAAQSAMLDAFLLAEGTANGTGTKRVFTQNPGPVLDSFHILTALVGKRVGLLYDHASGYGTNCVRQSVLNSTKVWLDRLTYEQVEDETDVWCPTVDEGAVIARQGGQVTITGNTTVQHQSAMVVVTKNARGEVWVRAAWLSPRGSTIEMGEQLYDWKNDFNLTQVHYDRSQGSLKDFFEQCGLAAFKGENSVDLRIGALRTLLEHDLFFIDMDGEGTQRVWSQLTAYRYDENGRVLEIMDDLVDALLMAVYAILEASKAGVGPQHEIVSPGHNTYEPFDPEHDDFDPTRATVAPDPSKRTSMKSYGI